MYFKLYQIDEQCQKYAMIGLVPFLADYFLEKGDTGFELYEKDFHKEVPIISGKYDGEVNEVGMAIDEEDYSKWILSFPAELRYFPFVTQFIAFEPTHVDKKDNVLFCFDWGLSLQHENFLNGGVKSIAPLQWVNSQNAVEAYKNRTEFYLKNIAAKEVEINFVYAKSKDCMKFDFTSFKNYRVK